MKSVVAIAADFLALACLAGVIAGCANGPCHQMKRPELAAQQDVKKKPVPAEGATPAPAAASAGAVVGQAQDQGTVLVFKPDGSMQCSRHKGLSAKTMEKQLDGIKVFSRDKRSDGLMHIQVCGQPTGMINVYEIPAEASAAAEAKGFKKLE